MVYVDLLTDLSQGYCMGRILCLIKRRTRSLRYRFDVPFEENEDIPRPGVLLAFLDYLTRLKTRSRYRLQSTGQ